MEKIGDIVRSDHRLSIRMITESIGIDEECVRHTLHINFNIQNTCARMMPKILTLEKQEARKNVCTDTLNAITRLILRPVTSVYFLK